LVDRSASGVGGPGLGAPPASGALGSDEGPQPMDEETEHLDLTTSRAHRQGGAGVLNHGWVQRLAT
jgi:hypothetical protein